MSATAVADTAGFLMRFLLREGALAEAVEPGLVNCVLTPDLQRSLALPESTSLRILGSAGSNESPFALESAGMQSCLDAATRRGRFAAAVLPHVRSRSTGVSEAVLAQFAALNGAVRGATVRASLVSPVVFEIGYDVVGEERTEGSVFIAAEPTCSSISLPLASALLDRVPELEPATEPPDRDLSSRLAKEIMPLAGALVRERIVPFVENAAVRLNQDARRISDYHGRLLAEARRRGRSDPGGVSVADSKIAAIERQREDKLAELVERHRLRARGWIASALVITYPAMVCDVVVRRRQRELRIPIVFDPILRAPLPRSCPACRHPTLAVHVCDEEGHPTCAACAAPCAACGRVTCRSCHPAGCRGCTKAPARP